MRQPAEYAYKHCADTRVTMGADLLRNASLSRARTREQVGRQSGGCKGKDRAKCNITSHTVIDPQLCSPQSYAPAPVGFSELLPILQCKQHGEPSGVDKVLAGA